MSNIPKHKIKNESFSKKSSVIYFVVSLGFFFYFSFVPFLFYHVRFTWFSENDFTGMFHCTIDVMMLINVTVIYACFAPHTVSTRNDPFVFAEILNILAFFQTTAMFVFDANRQITTTSAWFFAARCFALVLHFFSRKFFVWV